MFQSARKRPSGTLKKHAHMRFGVAADHSSFASSTAWSAASALSPDGGEARLFPCGARYCNLFLARGVYRAEETRIGSRKATMEEQALESRARQLAEAAQTAGADRDAQDRAAVRRVLGGDTEAFRGLMRRHASGVYALVYRLVGNAHDAEDVVQETFLRVYRELNRFDAARSFRTWLYTIAANCAKNALRTRSRRGLAGAFEGTDSPPAAETARRAVMRGELRGRLDAALELLPARAAALVRLHYTEGFTTAEAAEVVGMNEGAARVALHRARRKLREFLTEDKDDAL